MKSASWNPWHGCVKISPGCKYCYVYRQDAMYGEQIASSEVRKTLAFDLPVRRKRDGGYKIAAGTMIYTCFTSDFLIADADPWRAECWAMIRERSDCRFFFFTKRIDRLKACLPDDWLRLPPSHLGHSSELDDARLGVGWSDGYENVIIGCTVENQAMADYRLPIFKALPIRHKAIIAAPIIEAIDLSPYLDATIRQVATSGESGYDARVLDYRWILDIRRQCIEADVPFLFHQTGARLRKDGRIYRIPRREQIAQAWKAGINYRIGRDGEPQPKEKAMS